MFAKCNVETDLQIINRKGTEIPRSELEHRNDLLEAGTAFGLPMGIFNPAIPRQLRRLSAEVFNLPFESEFLVADERNALVRIHKLLNLAPLLMQVEEPAIALAIAAETTPVRYRVDDHQIAVDTIIDFLKTDMGQNLDQISELLMNDLITRHKQGLQMKLMEDMGAAMMAQQMMPGFGGKPMNGGGPQNGFSDQQAASPRETEKTQRSGDAMR